MPDRNDDGEENVTPGGDDDGDKIHIPDNEIHYVAPEKIEPYDNTVFGAGYVSNEWDAATGKGIITFDGPVTEFGNNVFKDCSSLTEIIIPDGVTTIGDSFRYCTSLAAIYCRPTTPPTGGDSMFDAISSDAVIYVPVGSGEAYKTAEYWSNYDYMIAETAF